MTIRRLSRPHHFRSHQGKRSTAPWLPAVFVEWCSATAARTGRRCLPMLRHAPAVGNATRRDEPLTKTTSTSSAIVQRDHLISHVQEPTVIIGSGTAKSGERNVEHNGNRAFQQNGWERQSRLPTAYRCSRWKKRAADIPAFSATNQLKALNACKGDPLYPYLIPCRFHSRTGGKEGESVRILACWGETVQEIPRG
ncbi:hypothetical protein B0H65DRAFT_474631 [Neurospora tetraspora]|uniref:Uncharacterized protein n=1 Tax=Neurospora tetraspora TaxID=94610 RepID=A0AAE0MNJ4_9PEZI|nr:hypothetical protein B0H65DRAFT_474631 [Neurospora tetraspora]